MRAALGAVEREDWDEAAAGFGKAADAFVGDGRTRMAQRARIGQANSLSETGALRKAATLLAELRASVPVEDDLWL